MSAAGHHDEPRRIPYVRPRLVPELALERARAFRAEMSERRSIRMFSDEPVPRELSGTSEERAAVRAIADRLPGWRLHGS
jgi:hypothetical protein